MKRSPRRTEDCLVAVRGRTLPTSTRDAGLTLVELLIVLTIMGVLSAIAAVSMGGLRGQSQVEACEADTAAIKAAQENYRSVHGVYAPSVSRLAEADFLAKPSKLHEVVTRKTTLPAGATDATQPTPFVDPQTQQQRALIGVNDAAEIWNAKFGASGAPTDAETRDDGTFSHVVTLPKANGQPSPCIPDPVAATTGSPPPTVPHPDNTTDPPSLDLTKPWLLTLQNSETVL